MELGFVGLGRMGLNMTIRLLQGGHRVVATDRSPGPIAEARAHGAEGAADAVISSFPGAGALAEEGGSVDLLVSLGPPPAEFLMPRIIGADVAAATRVLEAAGLTVEVASGLSRGSRIVRQNPPYGAKVAKGTKVVIELGSL